MALLDNRRQVKIIFHNVLAWTYDRRNELSNYYKAADADIILLNSTGVNDNTQLKIHTYNVYKRNKDSEDSAGIAIAVKYNIKHRVLDGFHDDMMAIEIQTIRGPIIISTYYQPPRRNYLEIEDIATLFHKTIPVYMLADLNARHRFKGNRDINLRGTAINNLINRNILSYLRPDFDTFFSPRGTGNPDMILANRHCTLNHQIKKGQLTTSDHFPIEFIMSTKPIVEALRTTYIFKRTNWEEYKQNIQQQLNNTHMIINEDQRLRVNKDQIENELKHWCEIINTAKEQTVPKKNIKLLPHMRITAEMIELERQYNNLRIEIERYGYTRARYDRIKELQTEMKEESKALHNEM